MSRAQRRPKNRRHGYDEWHLMHLREGYVIFPGTGFELPGGEVDEAAMRKAWEILRPDILSEWIPEFLGTRPAAWWRFDAPERRRRVDGVVHPFDDRVRKKRIETSGGAWLKSAGYALSFGVPRLIGSREEAAAQYESQFQFLHRHGLLTESEKEELL